jgi:peptidoglycan/LPS O-acetylase OafA/YrhL
VLLAGLDAVMPRPGFLRLFLGVFGFAALFGVLALGVMPYALLHDGLLMPLFGCVILGLAGENPLAYTIGARPLVFVGEASYCLYLLHFNMWNLIHDTHVLDKVGLSRFDPWISYLLLILMALFALYFIEKPAQRQLRKWMQASG